MQATPPDSHLIVPNPITRGEFLVALAAGGTALASPAVAHDGGRMMWDFMTGYIRLLDQKRRERFDAIETPEDLDALRSKVRSRLKEMWGPFPKEKTPLNPQRLGVIEREGYRIEKIIYESRPRLFVPVNLYRPTGADGPFPATIFPPGHAAAGKAFPDYQKFCIRMAQSGFVVLIWDPISQGERVQLWNAKDDSPLAGIGTGEHSVLGRQCYLLGLNLMQYRVWESIRAIDYLESRSDVDAGRIAMAGNSGGGMETLQFAGFEDRLQAAVSTCAVATFRAKTEALLIADPEQILHGTLRHGIDHPELLASFGPRPLMIGAAIRDYVPIAAARSTYQEVDKAYRLLNASEKLVLQETDDTHGLNRELRDAAVRWLSRWLNPDAPKSEEPLAVLPEEDLRCTSTGQVATSFDPSSVLTLNQAYAEQTAPQRSVPKTADEYTVFRSEIRRRVQNITRVGPLKRETGVLVPDRIFDTADFPKGDAIVVSDSGKDDPLIRRSVIDPLIAAGYRVIGIDLRGWGATKPALEGYQVRFDWDDFFAYRSLEIGRPLLGQRMRDLLGAAPSRTTHRTWLVVGVGAAALVALHAAVIDPRIDRLVTVGGLLSYRSLIDDPLATEPFSSYLPGVVRAYDIRDLYAALAPRRVLVVNPMSSRRRPAARLQAWEQLDWASRVYELNGAADSFRLETKISSLQMRETLEAWAGAVTC